MTQLARAGRAGASLTAVTLVAAMLAAAATAEERADAVGELLRDPAVKGALEAAKAGEPQTIEDQIRFCEVPAPSFKEAARAGVLKQSFQQLGLQNVRIDEAGNVLGDRPGAALRPRFVIAAHLDTVFPEGTDVKVTREGSVLHGPGIGDDCRGLAVLVSIVRALREARVQTPGSITFVADVGEEGLAEFQVPKQPKTTFNVGRIGGGTSVNSIPFESWMEVDMRSSDPTSLASVDASFHRAVDAAVTEENDQWGMPRLITVTKDLVGDRPAGSTSQDAPIVRAAVAVNKALGLPANLGEGSTDANLAMSLRIPAITIGGGGHGTGAHSIKEAFDTTDSWKGTQRAVLLTIALAQR